MMQLLLDDALRLRLRPKDAAPCGTGSATLVKTLVRFKNFALLNRRLGAGSHRSHIKNFTRSLSRIKIREAYLMAEYI
jgi:hypothetical protein